MKKTPTTPGEPHRLRQQAEDRLRSQQPPDRMLTAAEARALLHELQVHQIELEIQNEELQHAQLEAQQAAEKYIELFDFAPVGAFVLDEQGAVREVNLAGAALLGHDRERVAGQPFAQYLAPEARAAFREFCYRGLAEDGPRACETQLLKHGHAPCDVHVDLVPAHDAAGQSYGCRLAVADITERKRLEAQLRQLNAELEQRIAARTADLQSANSALRREVAASQKAEAIQARLALAVEQTTDSVVITDPTGTIVYTNPAFERISGYTRAEALGQNTRMLKSGKQDADFYQQMWALISAGIPWQGRLTNRRKDGSFYDEEATITPVCNATGEIVNYVAVKRDVTALVSIEAQRRQYEKMEALGRMAGAIAHHFNNKLQSVVGNLELVQQDTKPDEQAARWLGDAMRAAGEAAKISSLMLTYLGQAPSESKPLDLTELCRRSMPMLRASIPMILETDFASSGPVINANANQVQQLLTNLVTNAWEASRPNQGSVSISLKVVAADTISAAQRFPADWHPRAASYACLTVRDAGCGIAEAHLAKLFDPFFSTKFTGRGLGLAVVLGIVKAHGGVIAVESTPGQGSSFHVYFPVIAMAVMRPPEPAGTLPEFAANGMVLVVEDEEALLKLAGHYLRSLGFTVLLAPDGVVALDLFRQHPADIRCVISDVVMPRMDGWQTLEALRQLAPNLPVILASGYDEATVMGGHHAEKPQGFLSKPYTRDRLRAALARVLTTRK